jgi:CheY-like chemotaxis protein
MALRVLLADESATIKKVIQLTLQDFAVEVKSVPIGLDVLAVARNFNPDIILADILLSKKNGYEVCADLKADPSLSKIPVVLMWSGFMELDEAKAKACKANHRLEKPFDADTLRGIVKQLVPPTQENVISNYLSFPDLPAIEEEKPQAPVVQAGPAMPVETSAPSSPSAPSPGQMSVKPSIPSMPTSLPGMSAAQNAPIEMDEPEDFQAVPLPKNRNLSQFKIELPREDISVDEFEEIDLSKTNIALSSGADDISLDQIDRLTDLEPVTSPSPSRPYAKVSTPAPTASRSALSVDPQQAEQVLNAQVRQVVEEIAWKIIPDVVERIVREEIQKLMKDAERL